MSLFNHNCLQKSQQQPNTAEYRNNTKGNANQLLPILENDQHINNQINEKNDREHTI